MTLLSLHRIRPHLAPLFCLVTIVAACYAPALGHGFISSWDDYLYVMDNEAIRGFSAAHLRTAFTTYFVGNYAPLQIISYMLDYTLWGMNPAGFIAGNVLIHGINGLLLYTTIFRLHKDRCWAFLAAFIFTMHPVQVESVVWISQRKNLLAMLFFLLAFLSYLTYQEKAGGKAAQWYAVSLGAFLCALLSKSVAVIFPLVLFMSDFGYGRRSSRPYADKFPFLILAAAAAVVAMESQVEGRTTWHGGSFLSNCLTMLPVLVGYLRHVVWPTHLSPLYNPPVKTSFDVEVAVAVAFMLAIAAMAVYLYRQRKELLFWYLLFFIALLPVSQLVPLVTLMNDRYLYFPMAGSAVLAAAFPATLIATGRHIWRSTGIFLIALLLPLPFVTMKQSEVWRDSITLWRQAIKEVPDSDKARKILAEALFLEGVVKSNEGKAEAALNLFLQAVAYDPSDERILTSIASHYENIGETAEARKYYQRVRK